MSIVRLLAHHGHILDSKFFDMLQTKQIHQLEADLDLVSSCTADQYPLVLVLLFGFGLLQHIHELSVTINLEISENCYEVVYLIGMT